MQRKENETFAAYQARRAEVNRAVKFLNAEAKGGARSSREIARDARDNSKHAGAFGKSIRTQLAQRRATPARLAKHLQHVQFMADRATARQIVRRTTGAYLAA